MTISITKDIPQNKKNLLNILFYIFVFLLASGASVLEFFDLFCGMRGPHSFDGCDVYSIIGVPIIGINVALFISSFFLRRFRWIVPVLIVCLLILSNILISLPL